jgi:hypothetical protein
MLVLGIIICVKEPEDSDHSWNCDEPFTKLLQAVNRLFTQALSFVALAYSNLSRWLPHVVE